MPEGESLESHETRNMTLKKLYWEAGNNEKESVLCGQNSLIDYKETYQKN